MGMAGGSRAKCKSQLVVQPQSGGKTGVDTLNWETMAKAGRR